MLMLAVFSLRTLAQVPAPAGPPIQRPSVQRPATRSVSVAVDPTHDPAIRASASLVMQRLVDRLLDEGYRVVPAGTTADTHLGLEFESDGVVVSVEVGERRLSELIPFGERELMTLDLLQVALGMVESLVPRRGVNAPSVVVEMSRDEAALRGAVQLGLLEQGHALRRNASVEDRRLCVEVGSEGGVMRARDPGQVCPDASTERDGSEVDFERREFAERAHWSRAASEALRFEEAAPADTPPPITRDAVPSTTTIPSRTEPPSSSGSELDPHLLALTPKLGGGIMARVGGSDPELSLGLRVGQRRGFGGELSSAYAFFRHPQLRIDELTFALGADWRAPLASSVFLSLGAQGGVTLHRSRRLEGEGASASSSEGMGAVKVDLGWGGRRGALAGVTLRAGAQQIRYAHLSGGQPLWTRSGLFVGVRAFLGWDFIPGRRRAR